MVRCIPNMIGLGIQGSEMIREGDTSNPIKVLFISPHLDFSLNGGPALRTQQTVRTLSKLADLHFYDLDLGPKEIFGVKPRKPGASVLDILNPKKNRFGQLLQIVLNIWTVICYPDVLRSIRSSRADVVWINFVGEHSFLVRKIRSQFPLVLIIGDTDSVYSAFLRRTSANMKFFRKFAYSLLASLQAKKEKRLSRELDVLTAVSRVDMHYYLSLNGSASVHLFANVIEVSEITSEESEPDNPLQLLLPGSFGGRESAMTHGFYWFIREVWPKIILSQPGAKLDVVGRNASAALAGTVLDGVTVYSDVPDMEPFFKRAKLVICPLFFESGTRFKILEASKFQVPVVSTTLGSEGLDFVNNVEILTADDADSFAEACMSILNNEELARKIGKAARAKLLAEYSQNAAMTQAIGILLEAENSLRGK